MNKSAFVGIAFLVLFYADANAQWVQTGVPESNTSTFTSIVADEGNLYVATWGSGVYKSTDGGGNWTPVNNGIGGTISTSFVNALAVVPSTSGNGTNLFAGIGDGGIWRSSDDGASWFQVNDMGVWYMGVTGSTVLAGVAQRGDINGAYRSTSDGQTWTRCNGGFASAADSNVRCFASLKVGSTTYTYAGTDGGVFISTNGGASWTRISNGLPSGRVESLVATPGAGGAGVNIFAGVYLYGVYRSTDNGTSWTEANNGLFYQGQTPYVDAFVASPVPGRTTSNVFASYHGNVFVSTDNGATWENTGWPLYIGDAHSLIINGGMLYGASPGEIWKYSLAADSSWVVQQSGINDSLTAVMAVNNNIVWAGGTNGKVLRTINGGTTWNSVGGGVISTDIVNTVEALDANTALVAAYTTTGGKIFKTINGGSSWSSVYNITGAFIGGIQMKNTLEGYAVGSPVGGKWLVLKTINGGSTWDSLKTAPAQIADDFGPTGVQLIGDTLWFGTFSGSIYRSTDLGKTWTSATTSGSTSFGPHFNSPTNGLLSNFSDGSFYKSTDGGTTWMKAQAAVYHKASCISGLGDEFWATTGGSIAYSKNLGQSWSFSAPGHGGQTTLSAVSISPVASVLNGWTVGASGLILHYQRQGTTPVAINAQTLAKKSGLEQNYPNPFNSITTINYKVTEPGFVSIKVFNAIGTEVATLVNEQKAAGEYRVELNAAGLSNGIYFCRMQAGLITETRKLIIQK
jgi:hypothetical protein